MRRLAIVVVLLLVAGCENATASGGGHGTLGGGGKVADLTPWIPQPGTLAAAEGMAVVSVRRVAPGQYAVRARTFSGPVTLSVRVTSGTGFATLTSGTEVLRYHEEGKVDAQISTTAGYRYLIQALPGESDPMLLDYDLSAYTEIVP